MGGPQFAGQRAGSDIRLLDQSQIEAHLSAGQVMADRIHI